MNISFLTNEYPPHIYGGAGVHADHLSRALAKLDDQRHRVHILCFGDQREDFATLKVEGVRQTFNFPFQDSRHQKLLDTLYRNILMTGFVKESDIVHCHTWYTYLAGCLIKQVFGVPLVLTTHSLEPQRPWKEEQLGSAYRASAWLEKTAYENADGVIAVSRAMKRAVHDLYGVPFKKIRIIPNGIDTDQYQPMFNPALLTSYQINPDQPFVLFVGRITRQKGILHLINSIKYFLPDIQVVLCAGAPDTEEMGREVSERVEKERTETSNNIIWIDRWVPQAHIIPLFSHASVFICPSIYEPFGIVNLEAMACGTPVVASAIGGIPEVVVSGKTGWLVPFELGDSQDQEPRDPEQFSKDLATAVNRLLRSPEKREEMGLRARERVKKLFSWESVALKTLAFYRELIEPLPPPQRILGASCKSSSSLEVVSS
ncbi:MAG: glycogen synthase [Thermodesulfobacteriota bacterium]|nr:glycogen synthase [Thermodesulfobacteriota bacterium]